MIQEAVFVLLHIEGSAGFVYLYWEFISHADQGLPCRREKAIKDLLAQSAPKLDEWMTRVIVGEKP